MIKRYNTPEEYAAAGSPTTESRVAQIAENSEIKIDGVNVVVPIPGDGDAVFEDAGGVRKIVRRQTINKDLLDPSWTHVGHAFGLRGRHFWVMDKNENTGLQWLNCWQYAITAISAATIKFWLKMKGGYATFVGIEVALSDSTDGYINATSAAEITAALEAAGNSGNVGYANHGYWAFLDGDHITVQCDFNGDYRQYQCNDGSHTLVGCTMALSVWGDMPASSALWRETGTTTYWGVGNVEKSMAYYGAGGKTPTAAWAIGAVDLVTLDAFNNSPYCADLREEYGTYRHYIERNRVMCPHPDYGVFSLIDADEMTARYGNATFIKKDGTADYKFPPLHYGLTVGYGSGEFATGKWHLSDVPEGVEYMGDDVYTALRDGQSRMGTTLLSNNAVRWFARRFSAFYAWYCNVVNGTIGSTYVSTAIRCRAVTLCEL